jgi:hypothetical protein
MLKKKIPKLCSQTFLYRKDGEWNGFELPLDDQNESRSFYLPKSKWNHLEVNLGLGSWS